MGNQFRIAFVSGKLGDVDGVSLETDKWIDVLSGFGHEVFTISGKYAAPLPAVEEERRLLLEDIRFDSPEQREWEQIVFPHLTKRPRHLNGQEKNSILEEMMRRGSEIAVELNELVQRNNIDVIVAENTNAMPMTLLGGIALYKLATENRVATVFHHHDFWWERSRFSRNYIEGLLTQIMPPVDLGLEHVVISSYAAHILSSLKRVAPYVIPNCEDFSDPVVPDDYNMRFRRDLGFREDDILIVQPTRIVPRKRIEDSIELVAALMKRYPAIAGRVHYIISLYQGDEPDIDYIDRIKTQAEHTGVPLHLISERVASVRGEDAQGRKIYTNRDVLVNADLITYLPVWEGFGNALLEAIAARVPIVVSTYLVYKTDIKVTGITAVEVRDRYDEEGRLIITDEVLEHVYGVLSNKEKRYMTAERNFRIARREFGMETLRAKLKKLFSEYGDEIRASRKRVQKAKTRYSV